MNRLQLFLLLRKNTKLSEKRHPMFEANQYGKFFSYLASSIVGLEFMGLGTFLGWLAAKEDATEIIFLFMPFLLIVDFGVRFTTQQTPLMLVKPYLLIPVSKYSAIECFLVKQLLDLSNFFWILLFLPYGFIVWCGGATIWIVLAMLCLLHLMVLVNSQWYLFVRTLVNQSIFWWALPIMFYGSLILPFFFLSSKQIDNVIDFLIYFLNDNVFSWYTFIFFVILFVAFFVVNRRLQMRLIYDEISKNEKTKLKHVSEFKALNRFGQIGEYLKLEIKSTMRNKTIRSRFIQGICLITIFSLLISFTDFYNSSFEHDFWCLYAFIFFGSTNLTQVMCPEGNYIDFLMVHKENILTLLRAKYYYYCTVLVLPLLVTLIPVIMGQFSILMVLAYLFTATGPIYLILFQMAIYNKMTLPLNDKLTGKNQMGNKWQTIVSMIAMFAPIIIVSLLRFLYSDVTAYWVLLIIGVVTTLAEPYWMRNIYRRMMLRRYENLEGFHATR
ncbi:MAG: hypothetical protein J1E37_05215 [Prevotella sp.]|nr:hypothetical protein [Prevotella sp.]